MRLKESWIGEFIRHEGQEDRHTCNQCGTDGLLLNRTKNAWYCFGCCVGGMLDAPIGEQPQPSKLLPRQVSLRDVLQASFYMPVLLERTRIGIPPGNVVLKSCREVGGVWYPVLLDDGKGRLLFYRGICPSAFENFCCGIRPKRFDYQNPLESECYYAAWDLTVQDGDEAGILIYQPDHPMRYRTVGTRGLLLFGDMKKVRVCMIVEGLFDALAILAAYPNREDLVVVATLGKDVSDYQVTLLTEMNCPKIVPHAVTYVVGLDSDARLQAVELLLKLIPHGDALVLFPRQGKDWDELYRMAGGVSCLRNQMGFVLKRRVD